MNVSPAVSDAALRYMHASRDLVGAIERSGLVYNPNEPRQTTAADKGVAAALAYLALDLAWTSVAMSYLVVPQADGQAFVDFVREQALATDEWPTP